jgi:hypothetical protein
MKKWYLFCIVAVCALVSCKKDKDDDSFHITCKIDGVSKTFNEAIVGIKGTPEAKGIVISGASKLSADAEGFAFILNEIDNENNIAAGTYTDESTTFQLLANYYGGSDAFDYHAGTEMYAESVHYNTPIVNHFIVAVTSIDNNTVRGTFSGDFYLDGDVKGQKRSVTDGSFYVKLTEQPLP